MHRHYLLTVVKFPDFSRATVNKHASFTAVVTFDTISFLSKIMTVWSAIFLQEITVRIVTAIRPLTFCKSSDPAEAPSLRWHISLPIATILGRIHTVFDVKL